MTPDGPHARDLASYNDKLCSRPAAAPWSRESLEEVLVDQARDNGSEKPLVVDFGCGVGVALLGLVAAAKRHSIDICALGIDRGYTGRRHGDCFPRDHVGMMQILARHRDRIGDIDGCDLPEIACIDLERDPWPLREGTVSLAVSRTMVMFLSEKLRFIERVYSALRFGGVAFLHFDQYTPTLRNFYRLKLPPPLTFEEILADQRRKGVEIYGQGAYVITMRRTRAPLRFPLELERSYPLSETIGTTPAWGMVACYAAHSQVVPPVF